MLLGALDQTQHIAHAQDALRESVRVELLQGVELFAGADVLDRHARHLAQRQRRATARVAVQLGQDDPAQRHVLPEAFGDPNRLLAGHRVGDQQGFVRRDFCLDGLELTHELLVDLQTAGGIDDDEAESRLLRVFDRGLGKLRWLLARLVEHRHVDLLAERLQLGDGSRPIRVGGDQQRPMAHLADLNGQLPAVVVLPEPCRPTSITTVGGLEATVSRGGDVPRSSTS